MPVSEAARPAICLNMIVRNEAHVVRDVLSSVAPYIGSWVIVDTGSDDGTQDVIREHMAELDIPGELHERPWRDFGHNRSEALELAQGRGDYIWVMDADDMIVGTPDWQRLGADVYQLRMRQASNIYWYPMLFRDGLRVRYVGVTHEVPQWESSCVVGRLEGEYHIEDRHLGSRNLSGQKLQNDRDLLLAEVARNAEDTRSVFYLAQSYFDLGDFVNARRWYARRAEMGGWDQEVYYSMYRLAAAMAQLDAPWPDVQDAYLKAWEFRPTRAEPLHAIASEYRVQKRYWLGHLFARRAEEIAFPEGDDLFVDVDVYEWRAADERAVCAAWIGRHAEAFTLCRRLLARPDLPDDDRRRIADNRDFSVPAMIETATAYPGGVVDSLAAGAPDGEVTASLIAGPDRAVIEEAVNSFLSCCTDVTRVGQFLVGDTGLTAEDRAVLRQRYGFLTFFDVASDGGPFAQLARLRDHVDGRLWLHLGHGWRFFARENLVGRLSAVLDHEAEVFQVGINFADADQLTGVCAAEQIVRRAPDTGRYVVGDVVALGPAMFDTARLDRAGGADGGISGSDTDPAAALQRRASAVGLRTATLDEVLCIATTFGAS